jgi:hypothetical protein
MKIMRNGLIIVLCLWAQGLAAACLQVVDLATELPPTIQTPGGIQVSYDYDLVNDQYELYWQSGESSGGPFGPFPLTMACGTPAFSWESSQFMVFSRGCGTFCWYDLVYALSPSPGIPKLQKIERPLAFDAERNRVAYYKDQDLIHIRNLETGHEQAIPTVHNCQFQSGLCIADVKFRGNTLEYTWREDPTATPIVVAIDPE